MESGFSALAQVAATLFGLVLVSLVFAYNTAIARIDSIGDFSHFASWVWAAGFFLASSIFPVVFFFPFA